MDIWSVTGSSCTTSTDQGGSLQSSGSRPYLRPIPYSSLTYYKLMFHQKKEKNGLYKGTVMSGKFRDRRSTGRGDVLEVVVVDPQ